MKRDERKIPFLRFLSAGIIAGGGAALFNNLYNSVYTSVTMFSIPEIINPISILFASVIPLVVAAIVFFGLTKYSSKAYLIFAVGTALFSLLSIIGPLGTQLPDGRLIPAGFAALTIPMHFIAGLCAVVIIPQFAYYKK
jgi:hypothetical protein